MEREKDKIMTAMELNRIPYMNIEHLCQMKWHIQLVSKFCIGVHQLDGNIIIAAIPS